MSSSGVGRRDFLRTVSLAALSAMSAGLVPPPSLAATPRRFSLAYLTLFGCPPPEMTYIAARAGYDFVSLRPIYMGLPGEPNFDLAANPQLLAQTRAALASTGLRVHDIELAR